MIQQNHKYLIAGVVLGLLAMYVWHRRQAGPEGG